MNKFPYSGEKATQAAAWLVALAGGKMNHIKLSKLLYIADRRALKRWGRPIIGGEYANMEHGPVVSPVVDCLKPVGGRPPNDYWDACFSRKVNEIILVENPGRGQLHAAAIKLLDEIFLELGHLSQWELRDLTHEFPEYSDVGKSSKGINLPVLLGHLKKSTEQINALEAQAAELTGLKKLIGC
jgi:uncharacterized phage-associated protein